MCHLLVRRCRSLSSLIIFTFLSLSSIKDSQCYLSKSARTINREIIGSNFSTEENYNTSIREARNSVVSGGLFSLISFQNVPCNGTSGDVGVCFSQRECTNLGGSASGPCAGGYGVCCVLTVTCGGSVSINNTYVVNPDYTSPTIGPLSCTITVTKLSGAVQLYLEFTDFQLLGPTSGSCSNDSFMVIVTGGTTTNYPILCGNNEGQMDYIDLSQASGPVTLTFTLSASSDPRSWKIRLVQFKSTDLCAAPTGCFQYYRGTSGNIDSFNFNSGQGQFLNNYCYKICFQSIPGYCNLLLTEVNFMLSGIAPNDCMDDYLLANGEKFCGDTLNNGMVQVNQTSTGGCLSLVVCSGTSNPDMDLGFSLNYNLLPCMLSG